MYSETQPLDYFSLISYHDLSPEKAGPQHSNQLVTNFWKILMLFSISIVAAFFIPTYWQNPSGQSLARSWIPVERHWGCSDSAVARTSFLIKDLADYFSDQCSLTLAYCRQLVSLRGGWPYAKASEGPWLLSDFQICVSRYIVSV